MSMLSTSYSPSKILMLSQISPFLKDSFQDSKAVLASLMEFWREKINVALPDHCCLPILAVLVFVLGLSPLPHGQSPSVVFRLLDPLLVPTRMYTSRKDQEDGKHPDCPSPFTWHLGTQSPAQVHPFGSYSAV